MPSQRSKRRTLITLIIAVAAVLAMLGLVQAQGASKPKPTGWIAANPWHDEFETHGGKGEPLLRPQRGLASTDMLALPCWSCSQNLQLHSQEIFCRDTHKITGAPRQLGRESALARASAMTGRDVKMLAVPMIRVCGGADMFRLQHVVRAYRRLGDGSHDTGWLRGRRRQSSGDPP